MFKQTCPDVVGFTDEYPKGTKEAVDPEGFGRIDQDGFLLKAKLALAIFRKRLCSRCGDHVPFAESFTAQIRESAFHCKHHLVAAPVSFFLAGKLSKYPKQTI